MNKDYTGVIIEESLENKDVLKKVKILSTKIEKVTEKHKTPWLKKWTLHNIEIKENQVDKFAEELSKAIDSKYKGSWYIDFKNNLYHYIIFKDKVFKVNRSKKEEYNKVTNYGISLGIPAYQLDFSIDIKKWKR
jgi:hypothetical protein